MSAEDLKPQCRYWAFMSYNWSDRPHARALHRRLEKFAIPRPVRPGLGLYGLPTSHVRPVFRDDDEMVGSGVLDVRLRNAIDDSAAMVLLASSASADSKYVNLEVGHFVAAHGTDRLAIVAVGGDEHQLPQLPKALREGGQELLWVDCRGGRRLDRRGLVRIVAAVLGLDFDALWRRHLRRRRKVAAALAAVTMIVFAVLGTALWQQQVAQQRSPERQQAVFREWLTESVLETVRKGGVSPGAEGVKINIVRTDDLNDDGLIDYFVINETPSFCGSGGCTLDVYLTTSPGKYVVAMSQLGSSTPRVRPGRDGRKEIITTDYFVSREPIYSVYVLQGNDYKLGHLEFCDGVIYEACEPTIITPLPPDNKLGVRPRTKALARPNAGAREVTVGAGEGSEITLDDLAGGTLGVLKKDTWYLVEIWKRYCGFVPAAAMRKW